MADPLPPPHPARIAVKPARSIRRKKMAAKPKNHRHALTVRPMLRGVEAQKA